MTDPNYYRRATYLTSATQRPQFPADSGFEVAFAGRSNSGKSSAINLLTSNRHLARTSKTPGRTQMINFFALDDLRRLVDLPGYGYAKVAQQTKRNWDMLLDDYLRSRHSLQGVVLLMDCRHPLKPFDLQFIQWCASAKLSLHILLTKSDKLTRSAMSQALQGVSAQLKVLMPDASVQLFSSLSKTGTDNLILVLDKWLNVEQNSN